MDIEGERANWAPIGPEIQSLAMRLLTSERASAADAAAPRCPDCDGAGYYLEAVLFGHPHFGRLFPCVCTLAAQAARQRTELARLSNLAAYRDMTFATFNARLRGVHAAVRLAWAYARQPRGWLVLLGSYGVGKTHLAAAIAHAVLDRGEAVLLAVVPDLLDHLRATFAPTREVTYDARFEQIRTVPLLILDDLGTEAATPWAREKLYQMLNFRYQERLPTVITSNRQLDGLEPRLASRLADRRLSQVIAIEAQDYRRDGGSAAQTQP